MALTLSSFPSSPGLLACSHESRDSNFEHPKDVLMRLLVGARRQPATHTRTETSLQPLKAVHLGLVFST